MNAVQLGIRFVLELAAVVAAGILGANLGSPHVGLVGAAIAIAVFVAIWGLFLAPRARFPQKHEVRLVVGTLVMVIPTSGVWLTTPGLTGPILTVAILLNAAAIWVTGASADDLARDSR